ncbi:hypothetical protein FRB90_011000 [Tulasnella sp. 427]|nr:hypothetical protein FRB90_011000 [Tulasnella sp. 427]
MQSESGTSSGSGDLDPVLYISSTASSLVVCCHVERGGMRFLCPASQDIDPLYVFAFLERFLSILEEYLQDLSLPVLKEHFDVVYQMLEEMMDDGKPLTTESNTLRDIVLPPSFFNKVLSVAGVSGLSTATPAPFSSPIPWRKAGVKHNKNEIYFDIAEDLDVIMARNGTLLSSTIWGKIDCNSRLSGTPDLNLSFINSKAFSDPSFHPCVRLQKFKQTSVVSFVPPDGNFVLMEYQVSPSTVTRGSTAISTGGLQNQMLNFIPLILKSKIEVTEKGGSFTLTLTPRSGSEQLKHRVGVENVEISLGLDQGAIGAFCSTSFNGGGQGFGGARDKEREDRAAGTWAWEPKEKTLKWTISSLGVPSASSTWTLKGTWTSTEQIPRPSRSIMMHFQTPHMLLSGIKVDQLKMSSEIYKPYKGVKIASKAAVEWRW